VSDASDAHGNAISRGIAQAASSGSAVGAASVQLGAQAIAFAVVLNKQLDLSFGKIATLFRFGFRALCVDRR
jgi:hypothetical protein